MATTLTVHVPTSKPDGFTVPRPGRRQVDADGRDTHVIRRGETAEVPNDRYWRGRIRAGDVVEGAAPLPPVEWRGTIPSP